MKEGKTMADKNGSDWNLTVPYTLITPKQRRYRQSL